VFDRLKPERLFGARAGPNPAMPLPVWDGQDLALDVFFPAAWAQLHARQARLAKAWGLAGSGFALDQDAGLLEFERKDGSILRGTAQVVGSWNPESEVFSWAWGHPSVQPRMRRAAERARWFGERHGLPEYTNLKGPATESEAWRYAAVTMVLNGAEGVYRAPSEGPFVFLVFSDLALVAGDERPKAAQ
jgi:hypothetical protein